MTRAVLWVFLLAGLISPMVNGQFTQDYETTDDGLDDTDDDDETAGDDADTNDDYSDVFNDYFDDEMRVVDVDQDVAIKACVSNSDDLVNKIDSAYNKCFKDFEDWSEFQENNVGNDKDKDGLSDEYEADEACFYKQMGWVVNNEADKEAIKKDFENLNSNSVKNGFVSSIDACSGWNGKFSGRKKRDAEEDSWALSLARERRAAQRNGENQKKGPKRKKDKIRNRNGGKQKKGPKTRNKKSGKKVKNGRKNRRVNSKDRRGEKSEKKAKKGHKNRRVNSKDRRGKKSGKKAKKGHKNRRVNSKDRSGKKKDKGRNKKDNKAKKDKKKTRNDKNKNDNDGLSKGEKRTIKQLLPESVYNQLWCYELSVEKALEECVEAKILP